MNNRKPKNLTYAKAFETILEFFQYDKDKALAWYMSPNPGLSNMTPFEMIKIGRGQKLMSFITASISENYRD